MRDRNQPVVSIITVCLNSDRTIRDTLESVRKQSYPSIEHIIIDGVSTDNTLQIIGEFDDIVSCVVSEKDNGIYDAMNKGLSRVTGDVVYFLNSDDQLYDADVVSDIVEAFSDRPDASLVYGDVIYHEENRDIISHHNQINKGNVVFSHLCHQAVFARQELFDELGCFNIEFSINADYDWLLRVFFSGATTYYIKRKIAIFNAMGRHMDNVEFLQNERRIVRMKYINPARYSVGNFLYRLKKKIITAIESSS